MDQRQSKKIPDSLITQTSKQLRQFDITARKKLGQHFLIDDEVLSDIIAAANLASTDTVIEVGPGLGTLTAELAKRAGRVIAIELDDKLAATLQQTLSAFKNVTILNENVLDTDMATLLGSQPGSYKVVANLPYYITSIVLRHFLEGSIKPEMMLVMVQKEVAETIAAEPGKRSLLSISVQYYGKPGIVRYVPARAFLPPPEVDSAILRIDIYSKPAVDVEEKSFFKLVRAGFKGPRKQAANSLSRGLGRPRDEVSPLLEKAGIDPQRRTGTFTLDEWAKLWRVFKQEKQHGDDTGTG
jgi:16S rRNA (adenine1518-N6/adenine1519-N6)-dimethyltransferase